MRILRRITIQRVFLKSSDPPCKDAIDRFTTLPLKAHVLSSMNYISMFIIFKPDTQTDRQNDRQKDIQTP